MPIRDTWGECYDTWKAMVDGAAALKLEIYRTDGVPVSDNDAAFEAFRTRVRVPAEEIRGTLRNNKPKLNYHKDDKLKYEQANAAAKALDEWAVQSITRWTGDFEQRRALAEELGNMHATFGGLTVLQAFSTRRQVRLLVQVQDAPLLDQLQNTLGDLGLPNL